MVMRTREQGAGSREQGAGSREQGAGSREQGAGAHRGKFFTFGSGVGSLPAPMLHTSSISLLV
ncbi:hypothetical protein BJP34_12075 [Moorena producens PAL-8-15-08-1]|uniref:Uncharacterized protein n=1 Tax=Moorena producens PAL-8-15-08-1 TaxID=1458985 RepID=A0A1D8TR72_9CYAN|nr:hypothetical protein BJP34_12075 [Moorena producens PAL-8-15-08-1]